MLTAVESTQAWRWAQEFLVRPFQGEECVMKTCLPLCVALLFVTFGGNSLLGEKVPPAQLRSSGVVARISYDSTFVGDAVQWQPPRMCFEVYRTGRYRVSRATKNGIETLGGSLSDDQHNLVARMVGQLDFDSRVGGLLQRGSESFEAEVLRDGQWTRFAWLNPDHRRPFPDSAVRLIQWLQRFKPEGAIPLSSPEASTDPICPRMSEQPLLPVALPTSVFRELKPGRSFF